MRKIIIILALGVNFVSAQEKRTFKKIVQLDANPVESQGKTGTCWSFSTLSFLESELIRMKKGSHSLSEIFIARQVYISKAENFVGRHGKTQFSQGSLSHDLLNAIDQYGVVPNEVFNGLQFNAKTHNHYELVNVLEAYLNAVIENKGKKLSPFWKKGYIALLDVYLGAYPEKFVYQGKSYTPRGFADSLGIKKQDYITVGSFAHHPFYTKFILNIPDNWSNGFYFNVKLDELLEATKNALKEGYTVCWDGDVSSKGFNSKKGIALSPIEFGDINSFEELNVTQEIRQKNYENYTVTDDHLMHIVGIAKDNKDKEYFIVKNSWGDNSGVEGFEGHVLVSEAYFKMNTISVTLHKHAVPKDWIK